MINNFEIIGNLIFNKAKVGEFYFLQIIKRRKDNTDMNRGEMVIDSFFIKNEEDLQNKKDRIIEICNQNNARAYFRLNKRNERKIALQTLKLIAENIANDNFKIKNCYMSCCGQYSSDDNKTWLIDIDYKDMGWDIKSIDEIDIELNEMGSFIQKLIFEAGNDDTIHHIPTKNGEHWIVRPFNVMKFKDKYPNIEVNKDSMTLLYIP